MEFPYSRSVGPIGAGSPGSTWANFANNVKHNRQCDVAFDSLAVSTLETGTFAIGGVAAVRAGKGLIALGEYVAEETTYKPTPGNPGYGQALGIPKWI